MEMYDAFISYSRGKDKPIAIALQSVMQYLGKPWYRTRALDIFRDDTSLSAAPALWDSIERALAQSRYFILIASLEAAASKWVNREVAYWLDHNTVDTLLVGVTDGELTWDDTNGDFTWDHNTPLPSTLARQFLAEPKWVDLRTYRDGAIREMRNSSSWQPTSPRRSMDCRRKDFSLRTVASNGALVHVRTGQRDYYSF